MRLTYTKACSYTKTYTNIVFSTKAIIVVEFPFSVLRSLSIPPSDKQWDGKRRILAALAPMGAICVIFLDFSQNWCGDACNTVYDGFTQPLSAATGSVPMIIVRREECLYNCIIFSVAKYVH